MAKLVKLPNLHFGTDGGYINPDMVVRISEEWYRYPHLTDKVREPEKITVLHALPNVKFEFAGHIQDELAQLIFGE